MGHTPEVTRALGPHTPPPTFIPPQLGQAGLGRRGCRKPWCRAQEVLSRPLWAKRAVCPRTRVGEQEVGTGTCCPTEVAWKGMGEAWREAGGRSVREEEGSSDTPHSTHRGVASGRLSQSPALPAHLGKVWIFQAFPAQLAMGVRKEGLGPPGGQKRASRRPRHGWGSPSSISSLANGLQELLLLTELETEPLG